MLLSRILVEEEEFVAWLENFLPQLFDETFVLVPGEVNDPFDLCNSLWLCLSGECPCQSRFVLTSFPSALMI